MQVRFATPADAGAIAHIHVETWQAAYRGLLPDALLDGLSEGKRAAFWGKRLAQTRGTVFVAEDNGCVAGFCELVPTRDKDVPPDGVAEIVAIYVLPAYWRKGAGRALCHRAIKEARRGGFRAVTLWVLESNRPARAFYEALGFELDGAAKTEHAEDGSELHEVRFRRVS